MRFLIVSISLLSLLTAGRAFGADPIFPGAHQGSVGVATGVPFVGMGELAYAPSDGFAVGAIVGITPFVFGAGLRPRVGLPLDASGTRVSLVTPLIYYPTGEGFFGSGPPWFLAQPGLRLERRFGESLYAHVGAGAIAAVGFPSRDERGEMVVTYNNRRVVERDTPWGIWNTVGAGGAISVFDRTAVFADAMLILRGIRPAGPEWIGGPPFAFTLGVVRSL
ncbi:hypothetical protein LZC95_52450 [Pendulispora brunnea]|uniref:Uncharacterized protein n=1 Tax=Pendulispora brunnea TaxID=2905690 RepID=A0ABZ2K8M7_9BACT